MLAEHGADLRALFGRQLAGTRRRALACGRIVLLGRGFVRLRSSCRPGRAARQTCSSGRLYLRRIYSSDCLCPCGRFPAPCPAPGLSSPESCVRISALARSSGPARFSRPERFAARPVPAPGTSFLFVGSCADATLTVSSNAAAVDNRCAFFMTFFLWSSFPRNNNPSRQCWFPRPRLIALVPPALRSGFRQGTLAGGIKEGTLAILTSAIDTGSAEFPRQCRKDARAHRRIAGAPRRGRARRLGASRANVMCRAASCFRANA